MFNQNFDWQIPSAVPKSKDTAETISSTFQINCFNLPPRLYCPNMEAVQPLHFNEIQNDPVVINNIQLLKYIEDLKSRIEILTSLKNRNEFPSYFNERLPAIPEITGPNIFDKFTNDSNSFHPKDSERFGEKNTIFYASNRMDDKFALSLLRRSVLSIFLNQGTKLCTRSVLDVLADVCKDYIQNFCRSFKNFSTKKNEIAKLEPISLALLHHNIENESELVEFYSRTVATLNKRLRFQISTLAHHYQSQLDKINDA